MNNDSQNERFGLIRLGEIQSFLREIIGDDELYKIAQIKMLKGELENIEKDSCRKKWDRYCKEETKNHENVQDYIDYRITSHDSISALVANFFDSLNKKYKLNSFLTNLIFSLCSSFYNSLAHYNYKKDTSYLATECKTNSFANMIICKVLCLEIADLSQKIGITETKKYLSSIQNLFYKNLFDELKNELDCKSFEKLYEKLDKEIGYDFSKKEISKCIKTDLSPDYNFLEKIFDYCSENLRERLIAKFLIKNALESAKKNLFITDEDFKSIFLILNNYISSESDSVPENLINNLFENLNLRKGNPFFYNKGKPESPLVMIIYKILYGKKTTEIQNENFLNLIESMKKETPIIAPFFVPWFKALYFISKRDFSKPKINDENLLRAEDLFDEAFSYKYLAGDFIKDFLEKGFVFENYLNSNFNLVIKSYKYDGISEKQKNPVNCGAKKFYNFGYAIGLFPYDAERLTWKALNANDLFHKFFPSSFFYDTDGASKTYSQEFENEKYIEINSEKIYEKLSLLPQSKRNNLIHIKEIVSKNTAHNSKQKQLLPPLSICLLYCLHDERLLTLAEKWLCDSECKIDVSKVSYEGKTPLCYAFQTYKVFKLSIVTENSIREPFSPLLDSMDNKSTAIFENALKETLKKHSEVKPLLDNAQRLQNELEKIISLLIEKTDFETELKFDEKISTLSYAIDAFNFDFVKKLAEKIPDENFQNYSLYNEESPLMFAIRRKEPVSLGFEEFIRKTKDINIPNQMNSENLNFTREEMELEYKHFDPRPEGIAEYFYHHNQSEKEITEEDYLYYSETFGSPETPFLQRFQLQEIDKMIDYFISRTKNPDSQKIFMRSSDGDFLFNTALICAAQCNDTDTCRKLLQKGADAFNDNDDFFCIHYGKENFFAENNLMNNLCIYKSWETLIMLFDEFPEIVKKSVTCNKKDFVDSFTLFATVIKNRFIWAGKEKREYRPVCDYLIKRFMELGANPDNSSKIGSAREILSGTKLLDNY